MIHPLSPLAVAWIAGIVLLAFDGRRRVFGVPSVAALATVLVLDVCLLAQTVSDPGSWPYAQITGSWPQGVGIRLHVDRLGLVFACVGTLVVTAAVTHEVVRGVRSRLFPPLAVLLCAGLHGSFFTADLFNFYVFFELSMVTSFAITAYGYGRAELRGALVYVTLNLLGSTLFLLGVAVVYAHVHSLDYAHIRSVASADTSGVFEAPALLLFCAFALKLGLFPFHVWVPVVYTHARPTVAAILSGALVNVGAYGMLRLGLEVFVAQANSASPLLVAFGLLTVVFGCVAGLAARRAAEVIAFASIAQAGYVVLALGIGGSVGAVAALLAVISGAIDKTGMFLGLDHRRPSRARRAWKGRHGRSRARLCALVFAASVAGLPPTSGFIAKLKLFSALLSSPWALAALLLGVVAMIATAFRYFTLAQDRQPPGARPGTIAIGLAATTLAIGIVPERLLDLLAPILGEGTSG